MDLPVSRERLALELGNDYHYKINTIDAKTVYNKVNVDTLRLARCLGKEVCSYLMLSAIYRLIVTSDKVQENLKDQYDLTDFDKSIINNYIFDEFY